MSISSPNPCALQDLSREFNDEAYQYGRNTKVRSV